MLKKFLVASATSGSLYCIGDLINQSILSNSTNYTQTIKFGLIGATLHGPYFFKGLELIEKYFGSKKDLYTLLQKSIAGQIYVFPPFLLMLLGYKALLDNKNPIEKIKNEFVTSISLN